jgi:hypothetical protein
MATFDNYGITSHTANLTQRVGCGSSSQTAFGLRFRMAVYDPDALALATPVYNTPYGVCIADVNDAISAVIPASASNPWCDAEAPPTPPVGDYILSAPHLSSLYVTEDGAIRMTNCYDVPSLQKTSANGVVPFDGQFHGYQWTHECVGPTQVQMRLYVDNVLVLDGTDIFQPSTYSGSDFGWAYIADNGQSQGWHTVLGVYKASLYGWRYPTCGNVSSMNAVGYVQMVDTAGSSDFTGCTATGINTNTFWTAATITGIGFNTTTSELLIYGTDFAEDAYIEVQNPYGIVSTFTVVSVTSTLITLGSLSPAMIPGGTYCVTVTNPCI